MPVVMINKDAKHTLEMPAIEDQEPVQTLGATVRTNRSATPFASHSILPNNFD